LVEEMRAHLLARKPGTSTFMTLIAPTDWYETRLDGERVGALDVAGRPRPDLYGPVWTALPGRAVLVAPGSHVLEMVIGNDRHVRPFKIAKGENVVVQI
jgi:hypothetical protein